MVNSALFQTMIRQSMHQSPLQMYTFLRQAESQTQKISTAAEVFETTLHILKDRASQRDKRDLTLTEILSWQDTDLIGDMSGCPPPMSSVICRQDHLFDKYRTISGVCNNKQNPLWGAANTALARWLPAEYEDGERQPKGWNRGRLYNGFQLPLVHEVSKNIMQRSSKHMAQDEVYSQMLVDWGQYIDHDMSFSPQSTSKATFLGGLDCLITCENINPCFPIEKVPNDLFSENRSCVPFFRSSPACFAGNTQSVIGGIKQGLKRQQMNSITSFIDASSVYGSTPYLQSFIRNFSSPEGQLAINRRFYDQRGRSYLPFVHTGPSACFQDPKNPHGQERVDCFQAGDSRVNEILTLSALHTLWVREHNRIAKTLKSFNAHWSAEHIYQEARKIVGALHQIITIRDYVPKIIGSEAFDHYIGPYRGYDPTTDPSASNVFATAAFRFGHATISTDLRRLNESFQEHECFSSLSLHKTFFSPWRLVKEGGIEPVLRGLLGTAAVIMNTDKLLTDEVTERLVVINIPEKLDLASLNLQRGRDHALPGYNEWRIFCGLSRIKTLDHLRKAIRDTSVVKKIMQLYGHPDNIDVWLGGLVEDLLPGSRTGPLFSCLIAKQMKMLRDGDRFWWENEDVFTERQRAELQKHSLSRVICDNSDVWEVPLDAFRMRKYPDNFLSCNDIPSSNLEAWREVPSKAHVHCGIPGKIEHGDYILSSTPNKLVALYSCYHGYTLKGNVEIVCTENGWSGQPPQCSGK
ncbi:thyroid peroxidase [Osmerus eperlanus]|uniref:thyroid peroxidase n=1 Tax=Osmerus eperlanus TaxID=29151 RepID=UPI002E12EB8F